MGVGGEVFGVLLYRGVAGFELHKNLVHGNIARDDFMFANDCPKRGLGSRVDMKYERAIIKNNFCCRLKGNSDGPSFVG